jgi:hypothetical protein
MQGESLVMGETFLFILKSLFFAFFDIFQQMAKFSQKNSITFLDFSDFS